MFELAGFKGLGGALQMGATFPSRMRRDHFLAIALSSLTRSRVTETLQESVAEVLFKQQKTHSPPPCGSLWPRYKQLLLDALQGLKKMHIFLKRILPLATHPSLPDPKISCQNKQAGT